MAVLTKRFELRAPDDFINEVDALAEESGSTRSDVIRRALTLYARAIKEAEQGRVMEFVPEEEAAQRRSHLLMGV